MKEHIRVDRIGPGNVWKCAAPDCGDSGPLKELHGRPCMHVEQPGDRESQLVAAIDGEPWTPRGAS
jgi:hypothetical protein